MNSKERMYPLQEDHHASGIDDVDNEQDDAWGYMANLDTHNHPHNYLPMQYEDDTTPLHHDNGWPEAYDSYLDIDTSSSSATTVGTGFFYPPTIFNRTQSVTLEPEDYTDDAGNRYHVDTPSTSNKRPLGSFDSVGSNSSIEARQGSAIYSDEAAGRRTDKHRRRQEGQDAVNRHDPDPLILTEQAKTKRARRQREAFKNAEIVVPAKSGSSSRRQRKDKKE